jgi:hypothetical protein
MELYLHSPNTPSWRGAQLKSTEKILPMQELVLPYIVLMEPNNAISCTSSIIKGIKFAWCRTAAMFSQRLYEIYLFFFPEEECESS